MIATITGKVTEKNDDLIIIEAFGVGYGIYVTFEDFGSSKIDSQIRVYIYDHIKENLHDLFGFKKLETKKLFEQLLSVNGVGPKMALSVLNIDGALDVRAAIANGDTSMISRANGVGKRLAERIVVDLKDKVGLGSIDISDTGIFRSENSYINDEATQALISLGYSQNDAFNAVKDIDKNLPLSDQIKIALRGVKK